MEKLATHTKALSRFLQLLDGNFPSGAFVHSFGLEPHILKDKVTNIDELKTYLLNLIKYQYTKVDLVFIDKIFNFFEKGSLSLIIKEDSTYSAMLSFEFAKASSDIGHNYLKQIDKDIKKDIVREYFEAIKKDKLDANELCVLSAYAYELGFDKEMLKLFWVKKSLINIAQTTLKNTRIKPSQIQAMLFEFDDIIHKLLKVDSLDYCSFNPLFEEIIYEHKFLEPKMFST